MGKSKTLDEKIKELQEKLKNTELLKKQATQRKGLNLWNRIKILFLEDETIVDELLKDKEKLEIIKENIKKVLNKLFPEKLKKEVKEEKTENKENQKGNIIMAGKKINLEKFWNLLYEVIKMY